MKPLFPAFLLGVSLSAATVTPAASYPVDCAILLCLAGGWPASTECAHARAVFIRRITPWPIEPPLQIWNCPMRVSFRGEQRSLDQLLSIQAQVRRRELPNSKIKAEFPRRLVAGQADVDISDPAFDFVRSIRMFEITFRQNRNQYGDCNRFSTIYVGGYGPQGEYRRRRSELSAVPEASDLRMPASCTTYWHRSVFVEWRGFKGSYGHEEVHY